MVPMIDDTIREVYRIYTTGTKAEVRELGERVSNAMALAKKSQAELDTLDETRIGEHDMMDSHYYPMIEALDYLAIAMRDRYKAM